MNRKIHNALKQLVTDALALPEESAGPIQADVTALINALKAAEVVPHTINYGL